MSVIETEHMITRDPLIDGFTYSELKKFAENAGQQLDNDRILLS